MVKTVDTTKPSLRERVVMMTGSDYDSCHEDSIARSSDYLSFFINKIEPAGYSSAVI